METVALVGVVVATCGIAEHPTREQAALVVAETPEGYAYCTPQTGEKIRIEGDKLIVEAP